MRKRTEILCQELNSIADFDQFAEQNAEQFQTDSASEILRAAVRRSGIRKAELARRSGMSEVYLHQILSGRRTPSRNRVLALCLALGMDVGETNELLKKCAYAALYVRLRRDAAVHYALEHGWSVYELDEKLLDLGEETLL